jgi:hypothetical protein
MFRQPFGNLLFCNTCDLLLPYPEILFAHALPQWRQQLFEQQTHFHVAYTGIGIEWLRGSRLVKVAGGSRLAATQNIYASICGYTHNPVLKRTIAAICRSSTPRVDHCVLGGIVGAVGIVEHSKTVFSNAISQRFKLIAQFAFQLVNLHNVSPHN